MTKSESTLHQNIEDARAMLLGLRYFEAQVEAISQLLCDVLRNGHKLLACGNGGSAADASHLATEFVVRYERDRRPFPAISFTTNGGDMTAIGNDYGFEEIFARQGLQGEEAIRQALADHGILMSRPLGFNNTYALGIRESLAARLDIRKISDLREHPELKFGFSNEFMERGDGWPSLRDRYQLPQKDVTGLEHALAYRGLENGSIALTDLYSTDPEIRYYDLRILEDDLSHFPRYHAVLLYRADLAERAPEAVAAFLQLEGRLPRAAIVEMNSRAKPRSGERVTESRVAADFLKENPFFQATPQENEKAALTQPEEGFVERLIKYTAQHLFLVAVSLSLAILISVPLGIVAAKRARLGQGILAVTGIIQTLPGLALLVFIMALLHLVPPLPFVHKLPALGTLPAVIALFLYSLLPIIRNTYTGLHDIPLSVRESAEALGLPAAPG